MLVIREGRVRCARVEAFKATHINIKPKYKHIKKVTETTATNSDAKLIAAWVLPHNAVVDEERQAITAKLLTIEEACRKHSKEHTDAMVDPLIKNMMQGVRDLNAITDDKAAKKFKEALEELFAPVREAITERLFNVKIKKLAESV